jgi:hypothetical protein
MAMRKGFKLALVVGLAFSAIAAAAQESQAALTFATLKTAEFDNEDGNGNSVNTTNDQNANGTNDGTVLTVNNINGNATPANRDSFAIQWTFPAGNYTSALSIFTGTYSASISLTKVEWGGGTFTLGSPQAMAQNTTNNVTVTGGMSGLTFLKLTFTDTSNGDSNATFTLDAIRLDSAPAAVPEPGTLALFGLGAAGVGAWVVRRRKTAAKTQS